MKKRLIFGVCLLMLLPAILLGSAVSLPAIYQDSYYAELPAMKDYLHNAQGNRIILIGGSNIAFGVDTQLLEELLADKGMTYTVCSFGLYAAVGTSAMLDLSENELRPGDVVVLAFEPASEAVSTYFGATAFLKCAENHPGLIAGLKGSRLSAAIGNMIPMLQEKNAIVRSGVLPKAKGVYAKASFDERCNMTYDRAGNLMMLGCDTASPIKLNEVNIEQAFAEQVNDYINTARRSGAEIVMTFAPMNRSAMTAYNDQDLLAYFTLLNSAFDCRLISDPHNYVMDSGWFYDSNFHLNSAGAKVRTVQLAKDLLADFGCCEPVNIELPDMPASIAQAVQDSADTADFLFERFENTNTLTVIGLTEQGAAKTELAIPSSYRGMPVAAIAADALEEADQLVELSIPASIEYLPDGLFSGCHSLERLVLEHTSAPCTITAHSMDGAEDVQIFVPQEAYPGYRDGYGCEANLWEPYIRQMNTY